MTLKRRLSTSSISTPENSEPKRLRAAPPATCPPDRLSALSDELLIRILHLLPVECVLLCQTLSHKFQRLASDAQVWKGLYYTRFVLPRALRLPRSLALDVEDGRQGLPEFSSRKSKWLDEGRLLARPYGGGAKEPDWKARYKLRHNWSIGAAEVSEIGMFFDPCSEDEEPESEVVEEGTYIRRSLIARLVAGIVVTVDAREGLRAWDLKNRDCIAQNSLNERGANIPLAVPTCLGVDSESMHADGTGVVVGFRDGGFGVWRLKVGANGVSGRFENQYRSPSPVAEDLDAALSAVAYSHPYLLTITNAQFLSVHIFKDGTESAQQPFESPREPSNVHEDIKAQHTSYTDRFDSLRSKPQLLTSLKSHTCWPPISLSIRATPRSIIASIAYTIPTYLSGWSVGLQEIHLNPTGTISHSRLASAIEQGFQSLLSPSSSPTPTTSPHSSRSASPAILTAGRAMDRPRKMLHPTSLSYSHPYLLAGNRDNTLSLYLVSSTLSELKISKSTTLWGHTSSISGAHIGDRGKAVSVSAKGDELRVWELEAGLGRKAKAIGERSVRVKASSADSGVFDTAKYTGTQLRLRRKDNDNAGWVAFDDEVVILLKEGEEGRQSLVVYDFT